MKYSPEGGHIEIAAMREGRNAVITVTDDGPGIPAEDLPHILTAFTAWTRPAPGIPAEQGLACPSSVKSLPFTRARLPWTAWRGKAAYSAWSFPGGETMKASLNHLRMRFPRLMAVLLCTLLLGGWSQLLPDPVRSASPPGAWRGHRAPRRGAGGGRHFLREVTLYFRYEDQPYLAPETRS